MVNPGTFGAEYLARAEEEVRGGYVIDPSAGTWFSPDLPVMQCIVKPKLDGTTIEGLAS